MPRTIAVWLTAIAWLACLGPVSAPGRETRSLTVEEAVEMGLRASHVIHASQARTEGASARAREASAARLPAVRFGAGYSRLSEVPPFKVTLPFASLLPPGVPGSFVVSPSFFNSYTLKLGVQQPVFTGFRLKSAVRAAGFLEDAAELDLSGESMDVAFSVRSAYWSLFKAGEIRRAMDETIVQIKAHLEDIRNFKEQGLATKGEVLNVEARLASTELAAMEAQNAETIASTLLNSLLDLPLDTEVRVVSPVEEIAAGPSPDTGGLRDLLQRAREKRPDLKSLELRVKASQEGVVSANSERLPQVFLAANYYCLRPNPRLLPSQDKFYGTWDIGLTLSMDLWNWGQSREQANQAKAQVAQAENALELVEDRATLEVTQGYLGVVQARERIAASEKAVSFAEESRRVAADRFKEGLATSSDLLDAAILLLQAKAGRAQALADLALAKDGLRKALGE